MMTCEAIKPNYSSLDSQRMTLYMKYTFDRIITLRDFFEESSVDKYFSPFMRYFRTVIHNSGLGTSIIFLQRFVTEDYNLWLKVTTLVIHTLCKHVGQ